jgi:hypothetical protein
MAERADPRRRRQDASRLDDRRISTVVSMIVSTVEHGSLRSQPDY